MTKSEKTETDSREFWQMAIETWQASGVSVRQFCRQEGLSEPAFYSWRKKLADANEAANSKETDEPASFVKVSLPADHGAGLELLLSSGHVLRIGSATNSKTLNMVLSALRQVKLC